MTLLYVVGVRYILDINKHAVLLRLQLVLLYQERHQLGAVLLYLLPEIVQNHLPRFNKETTNLINAITCRVFML